MPRLRKNNWLRSLPHQFLLFSRRKAYSIVPLILIASSIGLANNDQQASSRELFEAGAAAGLQRLKESLASVTGSVTWTYWVNVMDPKSPSYGNDFFRKEVRNFWSSDLQGKVISDIYDKSRKWRGREVDCFNSDYAFVARQSIQLGPYFIAKYGRDQETIDQVKASANRTIYVLEMSYQPLSQAIEHKDSIISFRDVQQDGRNLVEVVFTFLPTGKAAAWDPSLRQCNALLDPSANWRVVSSVTSSNLQIDQYNIQYVPHNGHIGTVSKIIHQIDQPKREVQATDTFEFSPFTYEPILKSEFYLPSIGLPEVPSEGRTRFWRIMLVGGNIFVLGGLIFVISIWNRRRVATM